MEIFQREEIPDRYKDQVQQAQIGYVYETVPVQVSMNVIAGFIIAYVLTDLKSLSWVLSWFIPFLLVLSHRLWVWRRYNQSSPEQKLTRKWGHYLNWNVSAFALTWVYFFQVFFNDATPEYNTFLIVVIAGVTAGGFSSLSAYVVSFYSFILIAMLPLSIRLFLEGGKLHVVLAVLSIMFTIVLIVFAQKAHRHFRHAMVAQLKYRDINIQLEQQRLRIEKSDSAKARFLSTLSHDVRQPLHALHLFIQTLVKINTSTKLVPLIANIAKTNNSIRRFFTQMLDYSRIEARSIKPNYKVFPLSELMERLFIEYEALALDKDLDLRIVPTNVIVETDPHFLERILRNLLSNAIRYTDQGKIVFGCRRKKRSVLIQVYDSGPGVKPENTDKIFEEFFQVKGSGLSKNKGTGLGLSIASGLAGLMNTRIQLVSELGAGSCFSIEIPVIRSIENPENRSSSDIQDSSLLQAQLHLYCDRESDQDLVNAVRLWSPQGMVTSQINNILLMKTGKVERPDVAIVDENLFNDRIDIDQLNQNLELNGQHIPVIVLSNEIDERATGADPKRNAVYWMKKPVKPAMLRLMIEQII